MQQTVPPDELVIQYGKEDHLQEEAITNKIVLGHFRASRFGVVSREGYARKEGYKYFTFFRDPLQRAVSHYYYWLRTPLPGHEVWELFDKEKWSLEQTIVSHWLTNFHRHFVVGFPLRQFDFIGLAERYSQSISLLRQTMPSLAGLEVIDDNTNPDKDVSAQYQVDSGLAERFRRQNAFDYDLYDQAVAMFEERART